jgi:transposase-like protein
VKGATANGAKPTYSAEYRHSSAHPTIEITIHHKFRWYQSVSSWRTSGCKYLNNVIEQDHRTVKKRVWLAKGYGSFQSAWRTLQGIETVNMIRKGRVRWLAKVGQAHFIGELFGLSA